MTTYNYTKTPVSIDRLTQEIQNNSLATALDYVTGITVFGAALAIPFMGDLSNADKTTLDTIVTNHNGTPLPSNVVQSVNIMNSPSIASNPPYGSKTILVNGVTKKLYARNTGIQQLLVIGANTVTYTATYAWAKLLGVEVIGCEALDYADFKVYDNAQGTYSGTANALLNQFGYAINLPKDFYKRNSPFDADLYVGMVIKLTYTSVTAKTIGVNLIMNEVK